MHDSDERYPPPLCHPGTREVVIIRIKDWYGFLTRPDKPILWVHAPAGYGKTAIAGTVSKMLEHVEGLDFTPLGATFYFWRTSPDRNSPARFIITIAYQLVISVPELAPHVESALKKDPMILRKALEVQLVKLIVEPFKALEDWEKMPNRLVVIDGLDECINSDQESRVEKQYAEDQEKVQIRILDIVLSLQSHGLPLLFLILSRPEAWIKQHIRSAPFDGLVEELDLYALGDHLDDTEKYIRGELSRIAAGMKADETLEDEVDEWPGEDMVRTFVERTNGHMLYASIVIRHIENPYGDPRHLLKSIFVDPVGGNHDLAHSSPLFALYELYRQIMRSCPESNRSLMIEVLEDILGCSEWFGVNLRRAIAISDRLGGRPPGKGLRAIRTLHAVLRLTEADTQHAPLDFSLFIHSSFVEFLSDARLSLEFAIDRGKGVHRILSGCLDCMSTITPESNELETDHVIFAVQSWPMLLKSIWYSNVDAQPYLDFVKRILSIDLLTCSKIALTSMDRVPPAAFDKDFNNMILPQGSALFMKAKPLIKEAIAHVASSYHASLANILLSRRPYPWLNYVLLSYVLESLKRWCRSQSDWESEPLVRALKTLQRESPEFSPRPLTVSHIGEPLFTRPQTMSYIGELLAYD